MLMEVILDSLLTQFRVLKNVPQNRKLTTTSYNHIAIQKSYPWLMEVMYRKWSGDSANTTMNNITDLYNKAIEISDEMITSLEEKNSKPFLCVQEQKEFILYTNKLKELAGEMERSGIGLANLIQTYKSNTNISARLEGVAKKNKDQYGKIRNNLEFICNANKTVCIYNIRDTLADMSDTGKLDNIHNAAEGSKGH